ncbi:vascular cell adhesion protein 1 [Dendropsophus ebraccatus]|uniref:vascular cell adhesion protein 1 n=1 Tax=Dendropsophus ebraccatus TaxID=150705 RepID=UPI0038317D03
MAKISAPTCTLLILCSLISFMHTSATDITLLLPQTHILAQIGEELKIICLATKCSDNYPGFTWSSPVDNTLGGTVDTVEKTSTLTMKVHPENEGWYGCSVKCNNQPNERRFQITVYSFPSDPILHISSLVVGQPSRVTCEFLDIYPVEMLSAKILIDEKVLVKTDDTSDISGLQNISLTHDLILMEEMDQREIKCDVVLEIPDIMPIEKHAVRKLDLMYPPGKPKVNVEPSTTVKVGEEIHLSCSPDSKSQAAVHWVKRMGEEEIVLSSDELYTVPHAEAEDSGVYICYTTNSAGNSSLQVQISVQDTPGEPKVNVEPSTTVKVGEEIHLSCSPDSKSQADVHWVKRMGEEEIVLSSDGVYILSHAEPGDSGVYICYTTNRAGNASLQVQISVQGLPEKPTLSVTPGTRVEAGHAVIIECSASRNTSVTLYKMSEDGEVINAYIEGKIIIEEADPIDAAVYKCTAENQYGVAETSEILTVEYAPRETYLSFSSTDVKEGDTVDLTCVSKGVPTPSISIYKLLTSGESLLLSNGPEITLSNVTSGIYQCQAENTLGSDKNKLELMVQVPPKNTMITITPSHTMKEGQSVHIRCTSESSPAPTLALKMKTDLGTTMELEAEHGYYSISPATVDHTGTYICESSNVIGKQTVEATLTVQAPPRNTQISIIPSSVVRKGDAVQIRCTSEASPAPVLVLKRIMDGGMVDLVSEDAEYNITNAGVEDMGTYICESTNEAGSEIAESTLNVEVPPMNTFIDIVPSPVVIEGDSVQIRCSSEGSPDPRLVLKMRTEDGFIPLESSDGTYNITNVGIENSGTYVCESHNVVGQELAVIELTIQIPPRNTTVVVTPSQNIKEGDTVTITCETHSIPSPTIILQKVCAKNNTVLQSHNGTFTLHNVTRNDTGTYTLKIINSAGNETEVISIIVAEKQQDPEKSPRFNPTSIFIFGSVAFVSAGAIASIIYHLKKSKLQGSYSLVKALRSKV